MIKTAGLPTMRAICIFIFALVCCGSAISGDETLGRLDKAYGAWLTEHNTQGVLAVMHKDKLHGHVEHGMDAQAPVETASLSKAITAVCVAELVRAGDLNWDTTLDQVLGKGPAVTIGALMTHTSGIGPDRTQYVMGDWLGNPQRRAAEVLSSVLGRNDWAGEVGTYFYNNENYALLELVIERITGRDYVDVCRQLALDPAGAEGAPSPQSGGFVSFGGWSMPVADYARFLEHWFSAESYIGKDPFALPNIEMGGGVNYGVGMVFREFRGGHNFWHFGALCVPGALNIGTFAVTFKGDWTVVAAYDACVDWDAMAALDGVIVRAIFAK